MKYLLTLLLILSVQLQAKWNTNNIIDNGHKLEIICKNGYLTDRVSGTVGTPPIPFVIEETHCTDYSSWNGACNHIPIHCTQPKETE